MTTPNLNYHIMKETFRRIATYLTLGKYETDFSFRRRQIHTTVFGSIVTLLTVVVIGYFFGSTIVDIFLRKEKYLKLTKACDDIIELETERFIHVLDLEIIAEVKFNGPLPTIPADGSCFNDTFYECKLESFPLLHKFKCNVYSYQDDRLFMEFRMDTANFTQKDKDFKQMMHNV